MHKVIEIFEQRGYGNWELYPTLLEDDDIQNDIKVSRGRSDCSCLNYRIKGGTLSYQTSYFIGLDWLIENKLAAFVKPKMDNSENQIDYISMLTEVLANKNTHKHLSDLISIEFHKPFVEIEQKDDELSPFIIIQYLTLLRKLVQGGLKRSYYIVDENLNSRIKGKLLVERDLKTNRIKGKVSNACCRYQYYGYDSDENRILKKAFIFACTTIKRCHLYNDAIRSTINYIRPAFDGISDNIETHNVKNFIPNPLYQQYEECLRMALLLMRRFSYSIKPTYKEGKEVIATPPYWIDMSKLFELYVYQKLDKEFPNAYVKYHQHMNYQEIDILFSDKKDMMFVIDAKYKPKYEDSNISMYDIRQVCGYTRMSKVYEILGIDTKSIIPALIIYPTISGYTITKQSFKKHIKKVENYVSVFKYGTNIPTIKANK